MPVEVGIVGLPGAGKTTLFRALTRAGEGKTGYAPTKPNVGVAPIRDERLERVAGVMRARVTTPAALRVVDVPGRGTALLGGLRQVDALLAVVNAWAPGADPNAELEEIELALLAADRDHVERRRERVVKQAKSGDPGVRREVEELDLVLAHIDAGNPLRDWSAPLPPALEPLTTKPLVAVENGPGGIDCKLEAELAELPEEEAAAFRDGASVLDEVLARLFAALDLVTFFTADEKEARAWTLRRGQTALEAAAAIHSDMSQGFVRCEVVRWDELVACGSPGEAAKRGLLRLEGKSYVVEDGDILRIRFTPTARR